MFTASHASLSCSGGCSEGEHYSCQAPAGVYSCPHAHLAASQLPNHAPSCSGGVCEGDDVYLCPHALLTASQLPNHAPPRSGGFFEGDDDFCQALVDGGCVKALQLQLCRDVEGAQFVEALEEALAPRMRLMGGALLCTAVLRCAENAVQNLWRRWRRRWRRACASWEVRWRCCAVLCCAVLGTPCGGAGGGAGAAHAPHGRCAGAAVLRHTTAVLCCAGTAVHALWRHVSRRWRWRCAVWGVYSQQQLLQLADLPLGACGSDGLPAWRHRAICRGMHATPGALLEQTPPGRWTPLSASLQLPSPVPRYA